MLEKFTTSLRLYCERTQDTFFAEPLGLSSNLAFLLAAVWILRWARIQPELKILGWFAGAVGVGSGLFHAFPNLLTQTLDVIPIAVFCALFALRYLARIRSDRDLRRHFVFSALGYGLTLCLTFALGWQRYLSQGAFYTGIAPMLFLLGLLEKNRHRTIWFLVSAAVFLLAFTARSLDGPLCMNFPHGTHFLWHLLNAAVMMCLARVLFEKKQDSSHSRESP